MDPAVLGVVIGLSVLGCFLLYIPIQDRFKELYDIYKAQRQPLLSVVKENPLLLRSSSKQFQMKELLSNR